MSDGGLSSFILILMEAPWVSSGPLMLVIRLLAKRLFGTIFAIVAVLRKQIVDLLGPLENLNVGDNSIKVRQAAISGVTEAVEQLAGSQEAETQQAAEAPIEDAIMEMIEDDRRIAILTQWDRVQTALKKLADRHGLDIDLRSMHRTASTLVSKKLVPEEMGEALVQLYKSCKYARRVYEFDLPEETVIAYVRATNGAIQALKKLESIESLDPLRKVLFAFNLGIVAPPEPLDLVERLLFEFV